MKKEPVAIWLFFCCIMIIVMIFIGGVTRLTKAGLSITEWKPITGILPPLNKNQWLLEKEKYQKTPEYKVFNYDIDMGDFKKIYLIEYIHRLFARITGLIFCIPFIYFLIKKKLPKTLVIKLSIIFILGLIQGCAGWYMVRSGLVNQPHVSHYRLAMHLVLTLMIFSMLWLEFVEYIIDQKNKVEVSISSTVLLILILSLTFIQIIYGAFVAGLNAGLIYNTFPLMDDQIIPQDLFFMEPKWLNIFQNSVAVQFIHRNLAFIIITFTILVVIKNKKVKPLLILLLCLIVQATLGVITLLLKVPMVFASAHQVFAFISFAMNLYVLKMRKATK
ncbi:MAG: heme A synthase [Candidatus Mesenet longicola]|uniref:Heme A synthase n=1 Tax=Candidatus Mesenet longicola TaxID=1892558 RepID=A0A8J3HUT5_9RICK|nr:MAG: heme A synthase [Candidatus Mesenet longicola]GHM59305.1 MAG: heme A synthase [Candidatus Mesenet longicola]